MKIKFLISQPGHTAQESRAVANFLVVTGVRSWPRHVYPSVHPDCRLLVA